MDTRIKDFENLAPYKLYKVDNHMVMILSVQNTLFKSIIKSPGWSYRSYYYTTLQEALDAAVDAVKEKIISEAN